MKRLKSLIPVIMLFTIFVSNSYAAHVTVTYAGMSDYRNSSTPSLGNRAGKQYVLNLAQAFAKSLSSYNTVGIEYDARLTKSKFLNIANSIIPQTLFAYAGHGYAGEDKGPIVNDGVVKKTDVKLKHDYVVMYTCNWLTNRGSTSQQEAILKTFNGTRLQLGFASQMYLDSREAGEFVELTKTQTVGSAFVNAAVKYQCQNSSPVTVKVTGLKDARMDYIDSGKELAPSYDGINKNLFVEHFNKVIYPSY